MTLPMPHSTVNASNYDTLGNQLKGENHSSRMKRVNAMRRSEEGATLQPLGSVSDVVEQVGGPFALAALLGVGMGLYGRQDQNKMGEAAKRKSKRRNRKSAVTAMIGGGILASLYSTVGVGWSPADSDAEKLFQFVGVGVGSAIAAGLAHGMGRGSANWL